MEVQTWCLDASAPGLIEVHLFPEDQKLLPKANASLTQSKQTEQQSKISVLPFLDFKINRIWDLIFFDLKEMSEVCCVSVHSPQQQVGGWYSSGGRDWGLGTETMYVRTYNCTVVSFLKLKRKIEMENRIRHSTNYIRTSVKRHFNQKP